MNALQAVFRNPKYVIFAVSIALILLLIAAWLPNISLLKVAFTSSSISFLGLIRESPGYLISNNTATSVALIILVAVLAGINLALAIYYFAHRACRKRAPTGFAGAFIGMLGIGCTACGSIILSSIFGLGATASVIGVLPLKGAEFAVLGIIILLISIFQNE